MTVDNGGKKAKVNKLTRSHILSLLSVVLSAILVATLLPLDGMNSRPPSSPPPNGPPPNGPGGVHVPTAPEWPPLLQGDSGVNSWTEWDEFKQGPEYLENLGVPVEYADYYDNMSRALDWTPEGWELLKDNGFVVLSSRSYEDLEAVFTYYWEHDLPVFITTDTILHVHHLLFDQMLQDLENASLRPMVGEMSVVLLAQAIALRNALPSALDAAATDAVVFYAVPNVLLGTDVHIPPDVSDRVDEIVNRILAANAAGPDPLESDWTQYKPRGHYDRSEYLKRYFRAMMWYGRASYDLEKPDRIVPASIIAAVLDESPQGQALWTRVYNATARFVGESDSLNHLDIRRAFLSRFGAFDPSLTANIANVEALKEEFASDAYYRQKILSAVVYLDLEQVMNGTPYEFPKIYQFMGQRYVIDSEIMQNVMFDRVPLFQGRRRGLPSGLDVAGALGSSRAVDLLKDELTLYSYETQLRQQWSAVGNKSEEFWNRTAYSRQVNSLREILDLPPTGAPQFAQTRAWATEKMNTALGSWAELRHDTILYAKQPYSPGVVCSTPDGWVEPYPQFYRMMAWLDENITWILDTHFDSRVEPVKRFSDVFTRFAAINYRLAEIAGKELAGQILPDEDVDFIRSIFVDSKYTGCASPPDNSGWLPDLLENASVSERTRDSRIVADVATDAGDLDSPPRILHVADGYFRHVVVAYQTQDGQWHLAVGPVYAYYEFSMDGFTRLTDDEWKSMLGASAPPASPSWASEFMVPP